MANELVHASQGTELAQAEYESVTAHILNSQATGDMLYASSATQLSRLAIGATDTLLSVVGGIPAWVSEINNITLDTAVAKGTWTASGTWTIPAVTLGGAVAGGGQALSALGNLSFNASGATITTAQADAATFLLVARNAAGQTQTVMTVVGAATVANSYITAQVGGTWTLASGQTWTLPAFSAGNVSLANNYLIVGTIRHNDTGFDYLQINGSNGIEIHTRNADNTADVLRSYWAKAAAQGAGNLVLYEPFSMVELTPAPSAVANQARLFCEDNGAGKTRLMVQMPTGAAIQLAIEV